MLRERLSPHRGVWEVFKKNGYEAYFVGGCVRDALLGRKAKDIDIATDARPEAVKKIFANNFDSGLKFGSVTIEYNEYYYDVTTFRVESNYSDYRRPEIINFTKDIKSDLQRRDFTVNAMAYNFESGHIDLFSGITDLNKKIIRAVGKPSKRFREDALRMVRAVRFACELGFNIESKTLKAIKKNANAIKFISKERIYTEFKRAVNSNHPEKLSYFKNTGLGKRIHSEFKNMCFSEIPRTNDYILRLVHICRRKDIAMKALEFLKAEKSTIYNVLSVLKGLGQLGVNTKYEIRKLISEAGEANAKRVLILKNIDFGIYNDIIEKKDCTSLRFLHINGTDLIVNKIATEGIQIRQILAGLLDEVMREPEKNNYDTLLEMSLILKKTT